MVKKIADTEILENLVKKALELGADHAAAIPVSKIETDAGFRSLCEQNTCGRYGKCWTCPPDVGDIDTLMKTIRTFDYAVVYQTIGMLEDSYDIEGMEEAARKHSLLTRRMAEEVGEDSFVRILHLGAGGCNICPVCARVENHPCRFPDMAISSLEAYGINVSRLAAACGMKYINGQNTVTYFGAVLCSPM